MNYFIVKQDQRILQAVEPIGLTKVLKKELLTVERMDELERVNRQFSIAANKAPDYIDFIERPVALFSDMLKQLIEKYDTRLPWKSVVLADIPNVQQTLYWLAILPKVVCLSPQTEFHLDGTLKKLVIDEEKAKPYSIFQIEGIYEPFILINIELAESILRRRFRGIQLQKVSTEGRWQELFS
ncbi:serine protease [Metasolibacillus meyeri]|uniref:Serine protease n=1 Tax=Metasolibacillus meyeri TaxID=1071052 RepID=A0AAW9NWV7_9BACL|nr:serine protease [Metasolibacillus meyeri]MEC1180054.1 serine protease [Metasolibacillus meyeri]